MAQVRGEMRVAKLLLGASARIGIAAGEISGIDKLVGQTWLLGVEPCRAGKVPQITILTEASPPIQANIRLFY